jgi:hypothetical protein
MKLFHPYYLLFLLILFSCQRDKKKENIVSDDELRFQRFDLVKKHE